MQDQEPVKEAQGIQENPEAQENPETQETQESPETQESQEAQEGPEAQGNPNVQESTDVQESPETQEAKAPQAAREIEKAAKKRKKPARKTISRRERRRITIICVMLAAVIVALAGYALGWYANRARTRADAERYRQMYAAARTESLAPTAAPEETSTPIAPTIAPTPDPTLRTPTPAPTMAAAEEIEDMPLPVDIPIGTPDANTQVFALPTPPPVQASFARLLRHNPDTVGFLDIDGLLSLPVVQRTNDNDYYLSHNFDGVEASEGALFMDGTNRLTPEDDCLIVYGHNMKNGAMFGDLNRFASLAYLKQHTAIHFDTIYENRTYVPFAAFTASMDSGNRRYFDVRQFIFDETAFELFTLKLQNHSLFDIPVDVRYGDRLLLLVTCDYANADGRFILALRQLRDGEAESEAWAQVLQSTAK